MCVLSPFFSLAINSFVCELASLLHALVFPCSLACVSSVCACAPRFQQLVFRAIIDPGFRETRVKWGILEFLFVGKQRRIVRLSYGFKWKYFHAHLPKFDEKNWERWSVQMRVLFMFKYRYSIWSLRIMYIQVSLTFINTRCVSSLVRFCWKWVIWLLMCNITMLKGSLGLLKCPN